MWPTVAAATDPASLDGLLAPTGGLAIFLGLAAVVVREYRKGRAETVEQAQAQVTACRARIAELEKELAVTRRRATARVAELEQELGEEMAKGDQAREALGRQAQQYEARLAAERDRASQALARAYTDVDIARAALEVARAEAWQVREWAQARGYQPPTTTAGG
jgi:septal ring factor EnvC (AmiA/AmiB activator)